MIAGGFFSEVKFSRPFFGPTQVQDSSATLSRSPRVDSYELRGSESPSENRPPIIYAAGFSPRDTKELAVLAIGVALTIACIYGGSIAGGWLLDGAIGEALGGGVGLTVGMDAMALFTESN